MSRVEFVMYRGERVLDVDLRDNKDISQGIEAFRMAQKLAMKEPLKSLRLLTDVTNAHYDSAGVAAIKEFSKAATPYMKASAIVGVDGLKRIIVRSLIMLTGRDIRLFDTREQALDWLISQ